MNKGLILCFVVMCAAAVMAQTSKWRNGEVWKKGLDKGMTEQEVRSVLGDPVDIEDNLITKIWHYRAKCRRVDGRVTERPESGYVKFQRFSIDPVTHRSLPEPVFMTVEFVEPDWDNLSTEPAVANTEGHRKVPITNEGQASTERTNEESTPVGVKEPLVLQEAQERVQPAGREASGEQFKEGDLGPEGVTTAPPEERKLTVVHYSAIACGLVAGAALVIVIARKSIRAKS